MQRIGKHFTYGYPHFDKAVDYSFPVDDFKEIERHKNLLKEKRREIGDVLLKKAREYIKELGVCTTTPSYPYSHVCDRGVTVYIGDGGRYAGVEAGASGAIFSDSHNLDSYIDRMLGFNLAADTLELIDQEVLAPRVIVEDGSYVLKYPLPYRLQVIPGNEIAKFEEKTAQRLFELVDMDTNFRIVNEQDYQEIKSPDGLITIKHGMCEGRNFNGFHNARASWIIARLLVLCGRDRIN